MKRRQEVLLKERRFGTAEKSQQSLSERGKFPKSCPGCHFWRGVGGGGRERDGFHI